MRQFNAIPAVRHSVPLLIGLFGPSGSGKTFSALRLATGIQRVTGGDIYGIDTESRRMLHYADLFRFNHVQFDAPFGSLDYLQAIRYCVQQGAKIVIVDSLSHEHTGPGGYLLTQEAEVLRMAGNDTAKRERVKFAAWIKPAAYRQQMIQGILQLNANFIFCFRAKEKIKPEPGKQPIQLGFMPIAGEEMLFEMTVNCLLLPKSEGVPTWRSDHVGERLMLKLPRMFEEIFAQPRPLDEATGELLAQWAKGKPQAPPVPQPQPAVGEAGAVSPERAAPAEPPKEVMPADPDTVEPPPREEVMPASATETPPRAAGELALPGAKMPTRTMPGVAVSAGITQVPFDPAGKTLTEILMHYDKTLEQASQSGMEKLKVAWKSIPPRYQHNLHAALERRHKPLARAMEARAAETAETAAAESPTETADHP
jgi:ABC-type dipeptide/oligopeptide/nickel transport system ATPase subunit